MYLTKASICPIVNLKETDVTLQSFIACMFFHPNKIKSQHKESFTLPLKKKKKGTAYFVSWLDNPEVGDK